MIYGNIKYEYTYKMTDTSGNEKDLPTEVDEKDLGILFHCSPFTLHIRALVVVPCGGPKKSPPTFT